MIGYIMNYVKTKVKYFLWWCRNFYTFCFRRWEEKGC